MRPLTENIDTTTPGGRLIFHVFGALAAFERDLVKGARDPTRRQISPPSSNAPRLGDS
jgi:DNA invertase Pin-like site-specific DNA recombinase